MGLKEIRRDIFELKLKSNIDYKSVSKDGKLKCDQKKMSQSVVEEIAEQHKVELQQEISVVQQPVLVVEEKQEILTLPEVQEQQEKEVSVPKKRRQRKQEETSS